MHIAAQILQSKFVMFNVISQATTYPLLSPLFNDDAYSMFVKVHVTWALLDLA